MAIVQISQITQRKGLQEDLPQLAGAEFGWSVDTRQLYIGNGTLAEGAPVVGNTEILTEFSDIINLANLYTYKGQAAGYTVQTGPAAGQPITQTLQSWLDQFATVKDFGAVGDGVTDDTDAINRALYQLFCREVNPQIRRSLFFPAGVYKVSDTIVIPPYATLYGEGADNSIISFVINTWSSLVSYTAGTLVEDSGSYYRSIIDVPSGIDIEDEIYWVSTTKPDYVTATGDSQQQTGVNIGNNSAITPQHVTVTNMRFQSTDPTLSICLVEDATECVFQNTGFTGPLSVADLTVDTDNTRCIDFASTASLVTNNITFENCSFEGTTWAVNTNQQIKSITISKSKFDTLYNGVVLGTGTVILGGSTGFRITGNTFDNIYAEGIIIGDVSLNASGYNMFYDVGNHFDGITQPYTSIIDIQSNNNISIGDLFQRTSEYSVIHPRINLNKTVSIGFSNAETVELGTYVIESGRTETLPGDVSSPTEIFNVSSDRYKMFNVKYTAVRGDRFCNGTLTVAAQSDTLAAPLVYTNDYTQNAPLGMNITVAQSGTTISINYTASLYPLGDIIFSYSVDSLI